jgi:hypothetical protein
MIEVLFLADYTIYSDLFTILQVILVFLLHQYDAKIQTMSKAATPASNLTFRPRDNS